MRYRKSCVTGTRSDGFAVATCTGGKSAGGICDGSGNAASTIESGSSEAAGLGVAIPVTDSTVVATSALAKPALPIGIACGSSASSALAVRDAARFWIGTPPVLLMPAEPKPASQATIPPARTTVPQNVGATVVNRRGFMIGRLQRPHLSHAAQSSMRQADFRIKI